MQNQERKAEAFHERRASETANRIAAKDDDDGGNE